MPTIFTHAVVPIAIAVALNSPKIPPKLVLAGILASIAPDLDVVGFRLGISYGHEYGHRGASHSLAFALILGSVASLFYRLFRSNFIVTFLFVSVSAASHGLLDMVTKGGLGIAYFWPWSNQRLIFPDQVISASPISLKILFSSRGYPVLITELKWVWVPAFISVFCIRMAVFFVNLLVRPNKSSHSAS